MPEHAACPVTASPAREVAMKANHAAVILAAVLFFVLGAVWYTVLAIPWLAGIGKSIEQISREHGDSRLHFIVGFVSILVMCYTLDWIMRRASVPPTAGSGALYGTVASLGLIGAAMALNYGFEARGVSLWIINAAYVLVGLAMSGAIIGGWKKRVR
jgi:hypothetical protein